MRIGIIGAGHIGGNLVRRFTALGHEVAVANSRGPETLADLVAETGARAVPVTGAAQGAEVVVVTVPLKAVPALPAGVLDGALPGAAVVDTCNHYAGRDGQLAGLEGGTPSSVWVAEHLGRPVVKAFNGIHAARLLTDGRPAGDPERQGLPVAGDDDAAKATVLALLDELGFDGVDAGPLAESWRMEPGTPVYGTASGADEVRRLLQQAARG